MTEQIHEIGYVNAEMKHAMISITEPALCTPFNTKFVQIVITIEGAIELRAQLNAFLLAHGVIMQ